MNPAMLVTVGIGSFALASAAIAATLTRTRKARKLPWVRRQIATLDLDVVRQKAMKRHGWDEAVATRLEGEYRDFLLLIAEHGGVVSPWSDALDLFWHEHILDTGRYYNDCQRIFGKVIQHDPHIERNPYRHQATIDRTMTLRDEQLATRTARQEKAKSSSYVASSDGFDVATWGCSTVTHAASCGASHGSSHDGHSGHSCGGHSSGHSCGGSSDAGGGHSCGGGHGCGGHGCGGGGCGGH